MESDEQMESDSSVMMGLRPAVAPAGNQGPPGLQGAQSAQLRSGPGCSVMITPGAGTGSPGPADSPPGPDGHEEPAWPWKDAPVGTLVQRIHQLQAERAQAFHRLEEGHRQYLLSSPPRDFPRYRSTVHEVTQTFSAASREVLAIETELAGPRAQPLLAGHVRSLQQLEQTRLTTVALLQLMGTPELVQQEDPGQMQELKMKVIKTMEAISEVLQDLRFDAESAE